MATGVEPGLRRSIGTVAAGGWVDRWWRGEAGWWGLALDVAFAPAELAYRAAVRRFHGAYDTGRRAAVRVPVPVVSVGNLAVGGTGKTPVTRWLVEELSWRGARPAVLHGGYAVDEPALHRIWHPRVPVIVGRDRVEAARRAIAAGADVLVLDDGFQHRRLARDLDLVLVAAETWTPRPRLLPRGPWREPPAALARAHAVAVTRKTSSHDVAAEVLSAATAHAPSAGALIFALRPSGWRRVDGARGTPPGETVAVAGVARPDLFVENAREAGAEITDVLVFADHHDYGPGDVDRIRGIARGRAIVTTAKDAVKLAPLAPELDLWILEQEVALEAGAADLDRLLALLLE